MKLERLPLEFVSIIDMLLELVEKEVKFIVSAVVLSLTGFLLFFKFQPADQIDIK